MRIPEKKQNVTELYLEKYIFSEYSTLYKLKNPNKSKQVNIKINLHLDIYQWHTEEYERQRDIESS